MKNINELLRPQVKGLRAYHVDEPDVPVKLHANENPYNLSEEIRRFISNEVSALDFNRYPDPECEDLRQLLAERIGVKKEQLVLGNGSDELIQMIIMAFGGQGFPVVFPTPTFSMYKNIAFSLGEEVMPLPLDESFELEPTSILEKIRCGPSITFISYPNNPTGNCFSREVIEEIIAQSKGIVVVDEAYFDYSRKTLLDKLATSPNLIILRTLSKIGFASLRLGVLVGSTEVADLLNRVRLPYNITSMSRIAALSSLKFDKEINEGIERIIEERAKLYRSLKALGFASPFKTDANFILFRVNDSEELFNYLIEKGVLIRNLNSAGPLENCMRVTVGTQDENTIFLQEMKNFKQKP
ncbi:MAG: histidinol-phosphate transaminase [Proteobacteria bacterium]|nr:histidinol-phosphate transaminase [Pseudomonadota bacterium]